MKTMVFGLTLLLLAGCNQPVNESQAEHIAYDAAADATAGKFGEISERIDDLESKVRSLELENSRLEGTLADLKSTSDWHKESLDRLFSNDRNFAGRLGVPVQN